jgi:hypothetical protein
LLIAFSRGSTQQFNTMSPNRMNFVHPDKMWIHCSPSESAVLRLVTLKYLNRVNVCSCQV